jgi:RHS repeat-associated protein
LPDGTNDSKTLSADLRWGLQAPVPTSGTLTKGSLAETEAGNRSSSFSSGNPFSLTAQTDTETINSRTYTSVFTTPNLTNVDKTPMNRTTTTVLDSLERISSRQIGALLPIKFVYDARGRLSTVTQGTRTTTLAYDGHGFLASSTDPLKLTTSYTHDEDGRLTTETLPDGQAISYAYDKNGNLTSLTPPGKSAHNFSFTSVDQISAYTPPAVTGAGATTYAYDFDRELTAITLPDGSMIKYGYDFAGRLSSTTTPTETINHSFDSSTGNLISASIPGGEAITFGYNGPLLTSSTWTGTVAGSVSRIYNNNFWVASQSINNSNTINFTYDKDGLLTKAGSLAVKHDAKDGLITGTTLGSATDARTHDTYGELSGMTAKYKTTVLYTVKFTRDADGRIIGKTETSGGQKNAFAYSFDSTGRLTGVKENGASISSYTYDSNSNRLTATTSSGSVNGTYDAQDRLLTYGGASYTYTANGQLVSQTVGSQTTSYTYDVLGDLIAATLPNGTHIAYILDPKSSRVGKEVNGVLTTGFLYDGNRIVAQLNGSNAIVSQFIYGTQSSVPDSMVSGGVTYRIFSDQLGSPRLVVNTATGAITEQISYDEFGNVISDTNPGVQPFGFAGGLYDQDTKLLRFGARDYNPAIGRWTAKDPLLFAGGDSNFYGYALADPVNSTDTSGLWPCKDLVDKFEEKIKDYIHSKGNIPLGPVSLSGAPDSNGVNITFSASLKIAGFTVVGANATLEVGLTNGVNGKPVGDLGQSRGSASITVLNHKIEDPNLFQTSFFDFSATKIAHNIRGDADNASCPTGQCSGSD